MSEMPTTGIVTDAVRGFVVVAIKSPPGVQQSIRE